MTDELRGLTPSHELDTAAERLAEQVGRLRGGHGPLRAAPSAAGDPVALHQRAHALAGRALVVAASRADTAAAILAAERMDAHAGCTGRAGARRIGGGEGAERHRLTPQGPRSAPVRVHPQRRADRAPQSS